MLIHTGGKPYQCPYCPYTGRQHNHIRAHVFRAHANRFTEYTSNYGQSAPTDQFRPALAEEKNDNNDK